MGTRPVVKAIVDAVSLYLASRKAKTSIDYSRLMSYLNEEFGVEEFVICVAFGEGPNWASARATMAAAESGGWAVWSHTVKHGRPCNVAQLAAEIEKSALRDQDILLMSGNGELAPVVLRATETYGVGVRVLSDAEGTSWMLRRVPDGFMDLMDHINNFKKLSKERHHA